MVKKTRKPIGDPEWRKFEKLVADLEQAMDKHNIIVESPGWLNDKDTGIQREIDVLVTVPYSPKPLYVMIECRRRSDMQDVLWIESLAAKRNSVNANHVIAVSSSGFGAPAKQKAKLLGIETRSLKELSPNLILTTVYISSMTFEKLHHDNLLIELDCGPLLANTQVPIPGPPASLQQMLALKDYEAKIFFNAKNQNQLSIADIFRGVAWEAISTKLNPGSPPKRITLKINQPDLPPVIHIPASKPVYLWNYTVTADFWVERIPLKPSKFYEYSDDDGLLLRRLEYDLSPGGTKGTLFLDFQPDNHGTIVCVPHAKYTENAPKILRLINYFTSPIAI